jgi:hypothetical protein
MQQITTEQLGWGIGSDLVAALGPVRDWFLAEVEKESSAELPQITIINSALEPHFFAISHLAIRAQEHFAEPKLGQLLRYANETVVGLLSELSFGSEWKDSNFEVHKSKISKIYYTFLQVRQIYYAKGHQTWRGKLARLISSNEIVDIGFLRAMLQKNLQDETIRIRPALIHEFAAMVVAKSHETTRRHFEST